MKQITEQEYIQHLQNGCELVAKVYSDATDDPIYVLIDNEKSLTTKISDFLGIKFEKLRVDYVFKSCLDGAERK